MLFVSFLRGWLLCGVGVVCLMSSVVVDVVIVADGIFLCVGGFGWKFCLVVHWCWLWSFVVNCGQPSAQQKMKLASYFVLHA